MDSQQFFTIVSIIANRHGCEIDIDFDTKIISFKSLNNDPIKKLQMICDLEDILGHNKAPPESCQNCQKEVYLGAVKINLD